MRLRAFIGAWALAVAASACGSGSAQGDGSTTRVVAAFYPLAYVAERVAGDAAEVINLTPPGVEPHDLELTPSQVRDLAAADLVLYLGEGFQIAVEEVVAEGGGRAIDGLATQDLREGEGHPDENEAHAGEDGGEGPDPHVWLDPNRLEEIAAGAANQLARIDPGGAETYERNLENLKDDLEKLDDEIEAGLAACERREIVTSHDAFGYLADRYDLEQVSVAGLDPEAEPTPRRIAAVADFARRRGVTTIFFEQLVSPDIAQTIAAEVGVETAVLDPLENEPARGDYLDAMRANLTALRRALGCT